MLARLALTQPPEPLMYTQESPSQELLSHGARVSLELFHCMALKR
jgi:hypothetical protein